MRDSKGNDLVIYIYIYIYFEDDLFLFSIYYQIEGHAPENKKKSNSDIWWYEIWIPSPFLVNLMYIRLKGVIIEFLI